MLKNPSIPKFKFGLLTAAVIIIVSLLFGGASANFGAAQLSTIGIALACGFGLLAREGMHDLDLPWQVLAIFIALVALPLLQLIPLPPEIWRSLPGRTAEIAIIDLAGGGKNARPIALMPHVNLQLFASLIALIAFALTVARLSDVNIGYLIRIMLGIAFIELMIGGVQFTTAGATFDFFDNSHKGWLLGTFANRNHAALFFASSILFTAALFVTDQTKSRMTPNKRIMYTSMMFIWLLGAVATGSRTGFALAVAAIIIASSIVMRGTKLPTWAWFSGGGSALIGIAALSNSRRVQQLTERFDVVGDDQRWSIWQNTASAIIEYMPWGSGFGSFTAVYNKSEPLNELTPSYVNNAHNDYLELLLEAGLPGALVLISFLVLVILLTIRGLRNADELVARFSLIGGGVFLLFAVHSMVDYPLRRLATAAVLFFAFGLLLRQFNRKSDIII